VSTIASYAIEEIWPFLSKNDLDKLESVNFKRVLGLSKYNRSRFVYALLDFDLFVSDLKLKFALPDTNAFNKFCEANLGKQTEICDEFYTPCTIMQNKNWQKEYFLKTGMSLRDLHVMVTTISFVKINIFILMPKQIVCVNIAISRVISIISISAQ
jgi:hypothetical protein